MSAVPIGKRSGYIPRNYKTHPVGCCAAAPPYPDSLIIPESEWPDRWEEQKKNKASSLDLREANYDVLKSLDQNGFGLCWQFSTIKLVMYLRVKSNMPVVRLSPWWVAGKIKNWRDEGGWGLESLEYVSKYGIPREELCPSYNRKYDTPEAETDAALHKVEEWWDGGEDTERNYRIAVSEFLRGNPVVTDYNSLSHSMCCVSIGSSLDEIVCDNSWGEQGEKGLYRIGKRKDPINGLVAARVTDATTK